MTYAVCNTVTQSVTRGITNAVRTTVQSQNQNQTVVWASCGCGDEAKSNLTVSYALLGLEPIA